MLALIIGLLSIAAGGAKLALMTQEVDFLGQFGFSNSLIMAFGVLQIAGGVLLWAPATRLYGALVAAGGFALSAVLVFVSGNALFGGVSLVPVLLAAFVAYRIGSARLPTEGRS